MKSYIPCNTGTDNQKQNINNQMSDIYVIGLAVAGWLATTWLAYRWGLHSQKLQREYAAKESAQSRMREFLGFLNQWRAEVILAGRDEGNFGVAGIAKTHQMKIPLFNAEVERVKNDFRNRQEFDRLTARLGGLTRQDLCGDNKNQSDVILKAFDDLIHFVE
jgi:hypothetical protein